MKCVENISGTAKALCLGYVQGIILMTLGILVFSSTAGFFLHAFFGGRPILELVETAATAVLLSCSFICLLWRWALCPRRDERMSGK